MISKEDQKEWLLDFEFNERLEHDPRTTRVVEEHGYPQLKFCLWKKPDHCYVMMDIEDAFELAAYIAENYASYEYDDIDDLDEYTQAVERDMCKLLSGEDFGCEGTGNDAYYWREVL